MNNIVISADCTCDLPESLIKKYSIQIVPFYITMEGARFRDYTEVNANAIGDFLKKDGEIISSEPPPPEEYKDYFNAFSENGSKSLIHISVSGKVSNAYSNAVQGEKEMENVHVLDSQRVSQGTGLIALAAAYMAEQNKSATEILDELKSVRSKVNCGLILKTTQYVANNGRVNQTASNLIDLFKIKPIIKMKNGQMTVSGIFIGSRTSYAKKYIRKVLKDKKKIANTILFIAVSGCSEELQRLIYTEATREINWERVYVQNVSATNLCNIGPGSIGIMFYNK